MESKNDKEKLLRKFINNECDAEELEEVFAYLRTSESDKLLNLLIVQELQEAATSGHPIDPEVSKDMRRIILEKISRRMTEEEPAAPSHPSLSPYRQRRLFRWQAAAVLGAILMLGAAVYLMFFYRPYVTYKSGFGEISTVILPDSSNVVLNGNSSIRYASSWDRKGPREVYLEGEAFFSVRHTPDDRKFIVRTSDGVQVEVLGTEFSVYHRNKASRVVLNSGKVRLNIGEEGTAGRVEMEPGDLVEIDASSSGASSSAYEKRKVNAQLYSSWKDGEINLHNTSFTEIKHLLEDTYGMTVVVRDTSLYKERFTGTVPSGTASELLEALAISFGLDIEMTQNQILFEPKE